MTDGGYRRAPSGFAAALSTHPAAPVAVAEAIGAITDGLVSSPSVVLVSVSGTHRRSVEDIVDTVDTLLRPEVLVGAVVGGVMADGGGSERDAVALWAAADLAATPLGLAGIGQVEPVVVGLPDSARPGSVLVTLVDPESLDAGPVAAQAAGQLDGVAVVGGTTAPGGPVVWGGRCHDEGGVGLLFEPGAASTVVSPGTRAVGGRWVVTAAEGASLRELGGRPALERLWDVIDGLSPADRRAAAGGLHLAVGVDDPPSPVGFDAAVVRSVLGADRSRRAVAIAGPVEVGQLVQFHVSDPDSVSQGLTRRLTTTSARSALLFAPGRAARSEGETLGAVAIASELIGSAVGGIVCRRQLGPAGGTVTAHDNAVAVALFA